MQVDWSAANLQVTADERVRWRELDDHIVLYHPVTDEVSQLDPIGADIWRRLQAPVDVQRLVSELATDFAAASDVVSTDVAELLDRLIDANVIQVTNGNHQGSDGPGAP